MSLTADEKVLVFLILGIPTTKPQDFDLDLSRKETKTQWGLYPEFYTEYSEDVIDAVNARFDTLTTAEQRKVQDIIEAWEEIQFEVVHVKTDKIELSFYKKRTRLRSMLRLIFPITIREEEGGSTVFSAGSGLSIG